MLSCAGRDEKKQVHVIKSAATPRKRMPNPVSKEERAKDAALAMREYEAEQRALVERTARLREQRLARDAAAARQPAPAKPQKRTRKKSAS